MKVKSSWVVLAVCAAIVLGGVLLAAPASAANVGADKDLAATETGTLGTKEWDEDQLPGALEIGLGFGSIAVMIAVMKWL